MRKARKPHDDVIDMNEVQEHRHESTKKSGLRLGP